ncbi:MAG: HlyD family secretion protein [Bryobacteraceae bacterium]
MRGKWLLLAGLFMILILGGAASYWVWQRRSAPAAEPPAQSPAPARAGSYVGFPGKVEALHTIAIPVPLDGRIESLRADVGQQVYEGQVLAQIRSSALEAERGMAQMELNRLRTRLGTLESRVIELNLKAAQAKEEAARARVEMDAAQKELLRRQYQFKEGAIRRLDLEQAQQLFESASSRFEAFDKLAKIAETRAADARRELDLLQAEVNAKTKAYEETVEQLNSGDVVAPVDGVIIARKGQTGQDITMDVEDLFVIATDLVNMRVVVDAPPPELARVRPGQEVLIQIAELPDAIVGKVGEVQEGRAVIEFTNPNPAVVKPGMAVHVQIRFDEQL